MSGQVRISQGIARRAGEIVCSKIRTAKIQYLDANGEVLLIHDIGTVKPGDTITAEVPKPEDFTF
jgi:hypothetical protein